MDTALRLIRNWQLTKPVFFYIRNNYNIYRLNIELQKDWCKQEFVLVHTMGKVGSSSIVQSLKNTGIDLPIYQTHSLTSDELKNTKLYQKYLDFYLIKENLLHKKLQEGFIDKHFKIITLVREPISRNISAFFQNLETYIPDLFKNKNQQESGKIKIEEIIKVFFEKYNHDIPLKWFDLEIKNVFGIDVFQDSFLPSRGYKIYKTKFIDLLLLRLEDINQCVPNAFSEFLDIESFSLKEENTALKKSYNEVYRRFKESIVFPEAYINKVYNSRYSKHFYSQEEINSFREKWSNSK